MAQTARKLNFMIGNEVAAELEKLVPPGQRSKLVSNAIAKELALFRRNAQTEKLMKLRQKTPVLATDEIVEAVRQDRQR
ncbi:MAG: hypothetical protein A2091_07235 [Desulfuromonadales bacterium GWD2_61_12]|nr:MAG: hypothetical protein A2005_01885 [Desulfuromonadales bacterium GWC2_61_20]OGR33302.1 MAG: hypothetical protein A2091_07235 [Desulfuromonadales bacterium GWD2_61_12]HAD04929.1 hypothetical protein [Desulfuromonas sp.]HBT82700.1 hypothetical protein [Desulfuromonas sp.]